MLSGFFVIGVVVGIGFLLAHLRVFTAQTQNMLARLSFYVAMPVLFVTMMAKEDISALLSTDLVASVVSIVTVSLLWLASVRWVWKLPLPETITGTFASAYVNAGNLGLPIATYVLDSPARVVPVILTQLLFLQPVGLALLDLATGTATRFTVGAFVGRFVRNPLTIATLVGVLLSVFSIRIPTLLATPLGMVGGMAVPTVLLAFGISLRLGPRPDRRTGPVLAWQTFLKLVAMPAVAWAFGAFVLHLAAPDLLAVTLMAGLPTAQNVFVIASQYGRGVVMARDTIFITTVLSVLTIFGIVALLA
ncbi:hypothetical protein GA0111570_104266 [Raineyella antarctica]|uniref:AEC family transporter n=1 Tax=Raineyella antarctica TaxID=1577474 RepID=A0A1G6GR62_9ACTN|nr:hypothetical protein GA0111570_104266 [Raineyella antarctica]